MADYHIPAWRDKQKIGELMSRIERHAKGEHEMTATQLRAAELFLKKSLPDLARTETKHEGEVGLRVNVNYPNGNKHSA